MFGYILGFTGLAVVAGILFELFNGYEKKIAAVAITTLVITGLMNWLVIYFAMPAFSHWLAGGYPWMFFLNIFIAAIISLAWGFSEYGEGHYVGGGVGFGVGTVLLIVYAIIAANTSPSWCNTGQIRQRIGILELNQATSPYPSTDLDNIIRVPASVALSKAGNTLSSGENAALGNYLQPNRAYIQRIQGQPYYVIDLKVTDWVGYRQAGEVIPGYLLVNANDENAPVEFRLGYKFKYAPLARFDLDLDRLVYTTFLLGKSNMIQDLDGLEVDDDFKPTYTGSVMSHVQGFQGTDITSIYQVDPETGAGTQLSLEEKPEWLDRVYPFDWVKAQVELWGKFSNHEACSWTQIGQTQIDWANDVTIPNGLEYQFTMTSMGNDPALTGLISVNPTTGVGTVYPMSGKTVYGIKAMVEQRSKLLNPAGYTADECEVHRILDSNTAYCILTTSSEGDYSIGGYAFVDTEMAMNNNLEDIAIASTFDEAYYAYQQVKARVSGQTQLANTQNDIQAVGTVLSNDWVNYGGEAGSYLINVQPDNGPSVWMLASGTSLNAAAAHVGTRVTATCYQQIGLNYMTVRYIKVEGVPDLDQK